MTIKIRSFAALIISGLLVLMSQAACAPIPIVVATETPGPKARAALALAAQAGNSDGIVVFGILIFVMIAVPIILRYRNLKTNPEASH